MVSPQFASGLQGGIPAPEARPCPLSLAIPFPPQEHMTAGGNCQTFSSSTVISYSNTGDGAPKVYQETSEMRSAPGGVSWRAHPIPGRHGQVAWLALFKRRSRVVFPGWRSQVWKDQLSMWLSASPRSGRPGGPCATPIAGWSRCPLGITSGIGLTSSSAPETTARGTRRSDRTISTWTRVSPLPAPACRLPATSP